jgi:hypothetical protein
MNAVELQSNVSHWIRQLSSLVARTDPRARERSLTQRHVIQTDEVYHIAAGYRTVQIIAGTAWLTQDGKDTVLVPGQQITLMPGRDGALLSSLRRQPVVVVLR